MGILVHHWRGGFVCLYIVGLHHLSLEYLVERLQQFHCLLKPAVHGAFRQSLHAKVAVLLDLTVVRHVVLILLKQDLCQQACTGYALVYRQQRHGCD